MTILIAALPETLRYQGNQFARCIGLGPADDRTFSSQPNAIDAAGNSYVVVSGAVVPHFAEIALRPLVEPSWGCDLAAAVTIPPLVRLDEQASPETVVAVFDMEIDAALEVMGLTPYNPAEELEG